MLDITIRDYSDADAPQTISAFEHFQDYFLPIDPLNRVIRAEGYGPAYLEKTLQDVRDHEGAFFVAEQANRIVGLVAGIVQRRSGWEALENRTRVAGQVTELYVEEALRRQGLGAQFLQRMERYLKDKGCELVHIEVFAPNTNAYDFYKAQGYSDRMIVVVKECPDPNDS